MKFSAIESRARFAMAIFLVGLLLTITLTLGLYLKTSRDLSNQRAEQAKREAVLLVSLLSSDQLPPSDARLKRHLIRNGVSAAAALYSVSGEVIAQASTAEHVPDWRQLAPAASANAGPTDQPPRLSSIEETTVRTENGFDVARSPAGGGRVLVVARPVEGAPLPTIFYVFSYQFIALILALGLIAVLIRWLLKPYRRMVEAARGSPVRASSEMSESEFVVKTFQALIEQLQVKERELAELHALERRRAEKSERFSERLIASIPSGLVAVSSGGLVTSANAYATEIFGSVPDQSGEQSEPAADTSLRNISVDYRTYFRSAPKMVELIQECLLDGSSFRREEVDVNHPDGRVRHLGLSISPIADSVHGLEGALCLITDLTEVIELRERMKLQESMANLGEMAAGLAHEFKNSLATIYGYVQLLDLQGGMAEGPGDRRPLDAMLGEVRVLAQLVTDFLNFAKPQLLTLSHAQMRSIIEDCAEELRPQLNKTGIELRIEGEFPSLPCDETMLKRAFSNLMRNAAEAIDPNSQSRLIEVTGSVDNGRGSRYAHIRIRDTGAGISSENLRRIFIPFFTTKSRGYGIGLALVQKILIAHGGGVLVERSDSSGTVFHCRLPLSTVAMSVELGSTTAT